MRGVLDAIKKLFFSILFSLSVCLCVCVPLYVCMCDHIRREYIKSNFCRSPWQIINGRNYGTIILKRNGPLRISNSREATKQWIARTISWVHHLRLRGMCYSLSVLIHIYLGVCMYVCAGGTILWRHINRHTICFFLSFFCTSSSHLFTYFLTFIRTTKKTFCFLHFTSENN